MSTSSFLTSAASDGAGEPSNVLPDRMFQDAIRTIGIYAAVTEPLCIGRSTSVNPFTCAVNGTLPEFIVGSVGHRRECAVDAEG